MKINIPSLSFFSKVSGIWLLATLVCHAEVADDPYVQDMNISGWQLHFDVSPGDLKQTQNLMIGFAQAFGTLDKVAMNRVIHEDFTWHLNTVDQDPQGITITGADAVIKLLTERKNTWKNVTYSNFEFFGTKDRVFQTYRVQGAIAGEGEFDLYGIDMYQIKDGKITSKDSYWKR